MERREPQDPQDWPTNLPGILPLGPLELTGYLDQDPRTQDSLVFCFSVSCVGCVLAWAVAFDIQISFVRAVLMGCGRVHLWSFGEFCVVGFFGMALGKQLGRNTEVVLRYEHR